MTYSLIRPLALAAAVGLAAFGSANAVEYTSVDSQASRLSFGYSQMNVNMDGSFGEFKVDEFSFDPDTPEAAKVAIEVALASVDAGYDEANTELAKSEWLNLATHPLARFESNKIEALGDNQFQVSGELSIKGKSKPVAALFTFKEDGGSGVFDGAFTFQRADFGIGEGQWGDFGIVANDIQIKFQIVAKP